MHKQHNKKIITSLFFFLIAIAVAGVIVLQTTHPKDRIALDRKINHLEIAQKISQNPDYSEDVKHLFGSTDEERERSIDLRLVIFLAGYFNSLSEAEVIKAVDESIGIKPEEKKFLKDILVNKYLEKAQNLRGV